jgi:hypothetical protein
MSFICSYCSKSYSNKGNLKLHQTTAKFCLKLQNKKLDIEYRCIDCNYITGRKEYLTKHLNTCKNKKNRELKEFNDKDLTIALIKQENAIQKKMIEELKKEAFKPKHTNITYNVQMNYCKQYLAPYQDLSNNLQKLVWTHYKNSYFTRGVDGVIALINKILSLEDNQKYLISFENSKQSFWRNNKDKIELDDKADKFLKEIFPYIREVANEKYIEEIDSTPSSDHISMNELLETRSSILRIGELGSKERTKCVNAMANSFYISNNLIKTIL